jgi:hypothetical protein
MAGHCKRSIDEDDDGADAMPMIDASPLEPDGAPADAAWPPNLLADPGFESSDDDWIPYLGSTTRTSTNPHSGAHALFVCKDPTGDAGFVSVYRDVFNMQPDQVPVGAHFRAYAWVRASPNSGNVAPTFLSPVLRERGGPSPFFNHFGPDLSPVTGAWTLVTADGVITDGDRTGLSFLLEAGDELDGTCFAIDDAYVGRFE